MLQTDNYAFRKLRNRLSQKAFRERKTAYIKTLEQQLVNASKSDNERIILLEVENSKLRQGLLHVRWKLESEKSSLAEIVESVSSALANSVRNLLSFAVRFRVWLTLDFRSLQNTVSRPAESIDMGSTTDGTAISRAARDADPTETQCPTVEQEDSNAFASTQVLCQLSEAGQSMHNVEADLVHHALHSSLVSVDSTGQDSVRSTITSGAADDFLSSPYLQIPRVWTHNYQMGPTAYMNAISGIRNYGDWSQAGLTNSSFTDHLNAIKTCVTLSPGVEGGLIMRDLKLCVPCSRCCCDVL